MHRAHSLGDHILAPSPPSQALSRHPTGSLQLARSSRTRPHSCQTQALSSQLAHNIMERMRQAHRKKQYSERAKTGSWSGERGDLMVEKKQLSENKLTSPFQNKKLVQMRRPHTGPRIQVDTPPQHYYRFIGHEQMFSGLSRRRDEPDNEEEDLEGSYLMSQQLRDQRAVKDHFRSRQTPEKSP